MQRGTAQVPLAQSFAEIPAGAAVVLATVSPRLLEQGRRCCYKPCLALCVLLWSGVVAGAARFPTRAHGCLIYPPTFGRLLCGCLACPCCYIARVMFVAVLAFRCWGVGSIHHKLAGGWEVGGPTGACRAVPAAAKTLFSLLALIIHSEALVMVASGFVLWATSAVIEVFLVQAKSTMPVAVPLVFLAVFLPE